MITILIISIRGVGTGLHKTRLERAHKNRSWRPLHSGNTILLISLIDRVVWNVIGVKDRVALLYVVVFFPIMAFFSWHLTIMEVKKGNTNMTPERNQMLDIILLPKNVWDKIEHFFKLL